MTKLWSLAIFKIKYYLFDLFKSVVYIVIMETANNILSPNLIHFFADFLLGKGF